jgi:hypothetical protein
VFLLATIVVAAIPAKDSAAWPPHVPKFRMRGYFGMELYSW